MNLLRIPVMLGLGASERIMMYAYVGKWNRSRLYRAATIHMSHRSSQSGVLQIYNRSEPSTQGPTWSLQQTRSCLVRGQDYIFECRLRLFHPDLKTGETSLCASRGEGCVRLESIARFEHGTVKSVKGEESPADGYRNGEWHDFYATVRFDDDELSDGSRAHALRLVGPSAGVIIEMDDVKFMLPAMLPAAGYQCDGNLVVNGDAEESNVHPYPIWSTGGRLSVIASDGGYGNYFRLDDRQRDVDSVVYNMQAPGCFMPGATYSASAYIRIQSDQGVSAQMLYRVFYHDGSTSRSVVATCPASLRNWVRCEGEFVVDEDFDVSEVKQIRFFFKTDGGSTSALMVTNWEVVLLAGPKASLVVEEAGVNGCWDEGAELLITSHTIDTDDSQVVTLARSPISIGGGLVRLDLVDFVGDVNAISTGTDSFPVEVALLSRNIVVEASADAADELLGGHMVVLHTPNVPQKLNGMELRGLGRQGELGRYPIHFHMCGNVDGSEVSNNSIRSSHQRCVVIHGTYNASVVGNVAYETAGHCYMIEDGGEIDNSFSYNLGANTREAVRLTRPFETDGSDPSTFWNSNPMNEWIGNVAAGSDGSGFWFELQEEVRLPSLHMPLSLGMTPRNLPLKVFRDNISHSNRRHGLRTYPFGFRPPNTAVFDNTISYKNGLDGVFLHQTENVMIRGGALADNRKQVDLDRADNIVIEDVAIHGMTVGFREFLDTNLDGRRHADRIVGIQLHSFISGSSNVGAVVRNVSFQGFRDSDASIVSLIEVDGSEQETGSFDFWTTLANITVLESNVSVSIDFRGAVTSGITNAYVVDLDSSMKPLGSNYVGHSTVLASTPEVKAFIDESRCMEMGLAFYCNQLCLRTVTLAVDPTIPRETVLRVSEVSYPYRRYDFSARYYHESDNETGEEDSFRNTDARKRRYYVASVPTGRYQAEFVLDDTRMWPTFVETTFEPVLCDPPLHPADFDLVVSPTSPETCSSLIRNGDMELSTTAPIYWLHSKSGLVLQPGKGMDGTQALADTDTTDDEASFVQYVDTRCIVEGAQYVVTAWVRLVQNDQDFECNGSSCPRLRLRVQQASSDDGMQGAVSQIVLAGSFSAPVNAKGYNRLQGFFTVTQTEALATSVALHIDRGRSGVHMFVDDVTFERVEAGDCDQLVLNGDFESSSAFWIASPDSSTLSMYTSNGESALLVSNREASSDSISHEIRLNCMSVGDRYLVSARFRLLRPNGSDAPRCDPTMSSGDITCPVLRLRSFKDADDARGGIVANTDHGLRPDGWYSISGVLEVSDYDAGASKSILTLDSGYAGPDMLLDDVSIVPLARDCSNLIVNGDTSMGTMLWQAYMNNGGTKIEVTDASFLVSNRENMGDGLSQTIDHRCLSAGSRWRVEAQLKLMDSASAEWVTCDPAVTRLSTGCPDVRVAGWHSGSKAEDDRKVMIDRPAWTPGEWNEYSVEFVVSETLASCDRILVAFRTFNVDWDLMVRNIRMVPVP